MTNIRIFEDLVTRVPGAIDRWHVLVDEAVGRCSTPVEPCRQFAACVSGPPVTLVFSPRMLTAPADRFAGLLAHEIGHALLFEAGRLDHSEREADAAAEAALGLIIRYDEEDVQTTASSGVRPRPARLG